RTQPSDAFSHATSTSGRTGRSLACGQVGSTPKRRASARVVRAWRTSSLEARRACRTRRSGAPCALSSAASRSKANTLALSKYEHLAKYAPVETERAVSSGSTPEVHRPVHGSSEHVTAIVPEVGGHTADAAW